MNTKKEIIIRAFKESDFTIVQSLYKSEGWMTPIKRPEDAEKAWINSQIAFVALREDKIIGLVRGLTDTEVTMYIAELLIIEEERGKGIGKTLIDECHKVYPHTRIDLLSSDSAHEFYKGNGFKENVGFRKSYY